MSEQTKNGFILESTNVLKIYENKELTKESLKQIVVDLNRSLNEFLSTNYVYENDFPIKLENELGSWEFLSNGKVNFLPKSKTEFIEMNITITPTGADFKE